MPREVMTSCKGLDAAPHTKTDAWWASSVLMMTPGVARSNPMIMGWLVWGATGTKARVSAESSTGAILSSHMLKAAFIKCLLPWTKAEDMPMHVMLANMLFKQDKLSELVRRMRE